MGVNAMSKLCNIDLMGERFKQNLIQILDFQAGVLSN